MISRETTKAPEEGEQKSHWHSHFEKSRSRVAKDLHHVPDGDSPVHYQLNQLEDSCG